MDPNQRHQTPVGTGMTQAFPVVQSGIDFQYGRMPGFQQMQGKSINIQGMVGNTVNTYNYISNFTGMLPQGQGSVMAGVPQGQGQLIPGIPQGQGSLSMMSGVPQGQGSGMAGVPQGQGSAMSNVPQGQGSMLSGIPQAQGSVVAGVSQQVQGSVMTGVHQQGQGSLITGATQQGQGPLLAGVPQGQGSLMANIQGAVPVNNYISAVSSGGALPSMGSFVASFNQPNFNMNQYVVPNYKGGMESWISPQQQSSNSLPSFGHFLMPQQYQQQSPRQQQPQQQHQLQQQLFPGNQGQGRFTSNIMQQSGMGQIFPSSVGNIMASGQTFGNMNVNLNTNLAVSENANLVACHGSTALGHNENFKLQSHQAGLNPALSQQLQNLSQMSQIPASCNQITNTTSSVITTISSRSAVPVTANVHIKTSVSPVVVPSSLSVPVPLQSNISDNMKSNVDNLKQEKTDNSSTGCDNISSDNTQETPESTIKVSSDVSRNKSGSVCTEQLPTQTVIVPFGWRRVQEQSNIVYYSPSNVKLGSLQEIKQYLASEGTCKCGLECPVLVEKIFNFDPSVHSRQWSLDVHCAEDLTQLCNHKRKIIAMATFHSNKSFPVQMTTSTPSISGMVGSAILSTSVTSIAGQSTNKTKRETKNKKKKTSQNPYDGLLVSQLLAQRDRLKLNPCKSGRTTPGQLKLENPGIPHDTTPSPGSKGQNVIGHQFNSLPSPAASDSGSQGRSSVKDPADDLGPISSGKPIKLDFSRGMGPIDGLQRMNVNTPSMSPHAGSLKTGNQFMQQNPLTVQTGFQQEQFKEQVFIQQSPHTPSGHSPGFTFPQNQVPPCANFGVGIPMGASVNMHQNPGVVLHGGHHTNFPFYQLQNPTPGRYIGQNMMTGHPFHGLGQGMPGPYHMGQQQGMFHPPNAILQSMADVGWPAQEPKKKQRKSRAKKDKKKVNCVFESDTPPPNVDVSQLQDHGKGPIPKVKTSSPSSSSSSFLENPTAFLAEQTAMISNSLTTTLSSPKSSNTGNPVDLQKCARKTNNSDTVDGDVTESNKVGGVSASSAESTVTTTSTVSSTCSSGNKCVSSVNTTQTSPCTTNSVNCTSSSNAPVGMSVSSTSAVGSSSEWRSSGSSSESHTTPNLSDNNNDMFTEDRCESLSPDSGPECPALNETITPSSVVHHTATNQSPDKVKSEQGKLSSNVDKNILQGKHISVSQIQSTVQDILTRSASVDANSPGKIGPNTINVQPSPMDNVIEMAHRCNRNVGGLNPIQQMLGCQNTNEFPASNLLSAAARAQMVQQQQMGLLMGQPSQSVPVSQSFTMNMNAGIGTGGLNVPVGMEVNSKSGQGNKGMQLLTSEDGQMLINQQGYPVGNGVGITLQDSTKFISSASPTFKISSTVSMSNTTTTPTYPNAGIVSNCSTSNDSLPKMLIQPLNGFTNSSMLKENQVDQLTVKPSLGNLLSQTAGQPMIDQGNQTNHIAGQLVGSVNGPMPPISLPLVTGVTNSLTQVIPAVSGSQSNFNQQAVMNMFNNMGMNAFHNGSMMVGQFPTGVPQEGIQSVPLLNGTIPATYINNVSGAGAFPRYVACSNGIVNLDPQSGTNNTVVDLGFTAKQGQLAQMITGETSTGCVQLKTSQQSVDMSHLNNKLSVQCEEQVLQPTVLFPNIQMPLVQVLGTEQMPVNQNFDKTNVQPYTVPNPAELQGMINQLQTGQAAPLNLMNVQQVWNNLTTGNNLTAMQLQTLQLQQQLIQQLQGMQTLISQFNVQGSHGNTITTVANKDGCPMATTGQLTFTVTTNSSLESVVHSESKTSLASGSISEAVSMGTMVNDVSTTSDLCTQDSLSKENDDDDGDNSSADNDNYTTDGDNQMRNEHENKLTEELTSEECEGLSSTQIVSSSCIIDNASVTVGTDNNSVKSDAKNDFKNGVNIPENESVTSSNESVNNQSETAAGNNNSEITTIESQSEKSSNQVLSNDCVQNQCQSEALNLSTCKSTSAAIVTVASESANITLGAKVKTNAKFDICNNEKNEKSTPQGGSFSEQSLEEANICDRNLKLDMDCDNELESSNHSEINTDNDSSERPILPENQYTRCSPVVEKDDMFKGCSDNLVAPDKVNTSTSSMTSENYYPSNQSHAKSSPEHRSSIAEKPVEATLPSDIITTKSMDIRNCSGMHLYQASHMVQAVELSSETAEKAADALTLVTKGPKRPRDLDLEDYLDDEPDDSTEEMSLSEYPRCFSIGDLVWGQIRGFPSWPGKVVHETEVIDGHEPEDGKCWVKWFGDHTFTEVEPDKLKSLSEGLEAHHRARKKHRKGRKMNSNLEAAIHEAMIELDRQAAVNVENRTQSKVIVQRGKLNKKKRTR